MVNVIHKRVFVIVLLTLIAMAPNNIITASPKNKEFVGEKSICFIENKGQIKDQYDHVRSDIDFKVPAGKLNIFIGSGGIHYQWNKQLATSEEEEHNSPQDLIASYRMDVTLVGANVNVLPVAEEQTDAIERYYTPGLEDVTTRTFRKITYKNIYNNIDWVLYNYDGKLKYDFIIHPGGNTDDIRMEYSGATGLAIEGGEVIATTPYGRITEHAPYTYYANTDIAIPSAYKLSGSTVTFSVDKYEGHIVIDPSLEWATYMGGTGLDQSYDLAVDTYYNVYMAGLTSSGTNVATSGTAIDTFSGVADGYVIKLTPAGVRLWCTYYGGRGRDVINAVKVNGEGDIVFSGVTDTSSTLASSGAHQVNRGGGGSDAFLGKLNSSGQRVWCTYYGGAGEEKTSVDQFQTYVTCDLNNNIYLVGRTTSDTGIATSGVAQSSRHSLYDGYIAKFNKNGVRQWGSYYGGTYDDFFTNVTTDPNGIVYVMGEFKSDTLGTSGTYAPVWVVNDPTPNNNNRYFEILIAKFNPINGQRIWATYYGGAYHETAGGIVIGDTNNIYISGGTQSSANIATSGKQTVFGGAYDAFVAQFDSTGQRSWGTYMGGSNTDYGGNITIDEYGDLNIAGRTASTSGIATTGAHRTSKADPGNPSFDAMLYIYSTSGSKIWSSYYGGGQNDYGVGVITAPGGVVYMCGYTESDTGIAYSGRQNSYSGGGNDGFLTKFTPDTSAFIFQPFTQTVHCIEDSFVLNYGVTNPFVSGNTFTVQLSNSSGSFASPVNIGSKAATGAGTINVGLPSNMTGSGFRIRIIATMPIDTSYDNGNDILIKPKPTWPVASNDGPVCSNSILHLSSTASSSGSTYMWTGPVSYVQYGQNVTRTNMSSSMSGDYIVTAILNGCTRSDTTSVTIRQAAPKPVAGNNGPLCSGQDLHLTGNNIANGLPISWSGPAFSSNQQNPTISNVATSNAGSYIVTVTQNNCDSKDTTVVTIGQTPAPVTASSNGPVCSSDTLWLYGTSATSGVVYHWQGPGGFTANTGQTSVARTGLMTSYSGDYVVTADLVGCTVKDTVSVTIKQAPAKPVASSNSPLCSGADLQLTGTNITTGASVEWFGPGGYNQTGANQTIPNVATSYAGTYILQSELTSTGCKQTDTITVSITQSSIINVTAMSNLGTIVCPSANMTFYFSPSQPTGTQIVWSGPGNWSANTDTATRNNVQYVDSGYYSIRVVTPGCGFGSDSLYLRVVDTLSPPVITTNSPVCEGDTLKLMSTHPGNAQRVWTTPGATTLPGASITIFKAKPTDGGTYVVKAEAGGCKAYDTAVVVIKPQPAQPNAASNAPLCAGETLNLTSSGSTSGITYSWNGPGGYSSTSQNPSIPGADPSVHAGKYLAYTILNGCPSEPDTVPVVIYDIPQPVITSDSPVVCEGKPIILKVNDTTTETYKWTSDNSTFSSTGPVVTINSSKPEDRGNYVVIATSTVTGCKGYDTFAVNVISLPGIMDVSYNSPLCEGKRLELKVSDTSKGSVAYAWTGPHGYLFLGKDAFKDPADSMDNGKFIVTASRAGCTRTAEVDVVVKPTPEKPQLSSNSPISVGSDLFLKVENPKPGATFIWKGPNSFGSFLQDPVIYRATANAAGPYTLTTTLNGCSIAENIIVVVNSAELNKESVILFPNPNTGTFTIKAKLNHDQIMPYEVVSILGTVVFNDIGQSKDLEFERKVELDGGLASGVYIFRIMVSGNSLEIPFSVVR
ncbi:MAG: hypothetical protein KDC07_04145 [Chitinophagaceae bacterium]|nr:hypothetical protein [Chitinophagaceae bacterium]MCB9047267.1 hypothetical protein [Chitinophagales bacterium]